MLKSKIFFLSILSFPYLENNANRITKMVFHCMYIPHCISAFILVKILVGSTFWLFWIICYEYSVQVFGGHVLWFLLDMYLWMKFNMVRYGQIVFQNGYTILHSLIILFLLTAVRSIVLSPLLFLISVIWTSSLDFLVNPAEFCSFCWSFQRNTFGFIDFLY